MPLLLKGFPGLPRATGDIDLWIKCSDDNAHRVWRAVTKFDAPLSNLTKEDFRKPEQLFNWAMFLAGSTFLQRSPVSIS